jgi:hypothetical protein
LQPVQGRANAVRSWTASSLLLSHSQIRRGFYSSGSGRGAIVVVQHAAQALAPLDLACIVEVARLWADELVRQALMIALGVIMGNEIVKGCAQRLLTEEDHALQAGLLDAAWCKMSGVGIPSNHPEEEEALVGDASEIGLLNSYVAKLLLVKPKSTATKDKVRRQCNACTVIPSKSF